MKNLKITIRKKLLTHRLKLPKKEVENLSKKIIKRLEASKEYKKAKTILLYHPIKNEVNTLPLLKDYCRKTSENSKIKSSAKSSKNLSSSFSKIFTLPRICTKTNRIHLHQITDLQTLKTGKFNIKEPTKFHKEIPRKKIDLVIVPGIAFDKKGHRIGFGKGYFDKLLKTLSARKIALAYDFQIIDNVPAEPHDRKVDMIVTEKRTVKIRK